MKWLETKKELAYSTGASMAVAFSVVAGLMIENPYQISIREIVRPLLILTCVAVLGTMFCRIVHRRLLQVFPAVIFAFFQYTSIHQLMPEMGQYDGVVTVAILSFALTGLFLVLRRLDGLNAARAMFLVSGAVAIGTGVAVAPQVIAEMASAAPPVIDKTFAAPSLAAVTATRNSLDALPDIIYVVPDRYPNRTTLRTEFGYHNSDFYRELRARGFVLNEDAWANYPKTFVSLASTLNGGYLDVLHGAYGSEHADPRPVYRLLERNLVQDRLRRVGYRYLHLGGWWAPTRVNRYADENYLGYPPTALSYDRLPEFERALVRKTILPTVESRLRSLYGPRSARPGNECVRLKRQLRKMHLIGNESRPVFAFVHLFIPHPPITMDANGNCLTPPMTYPADDRQRTTWAEFSDGFVDYIQFFNRQILEVIDEQIRRRGTSGRKLIFVIQSDEGPYPRVMAEASDLSDFPLSEMSARDLRTKMGIVNAILLPDGVAQDLDGLQSPINNWRIIFNVIFGTRLKMLPDKAYVFENEENIFDFRSISGVVGLSGSDTSVAR